MKTYPRLKAQIKSLEENITYWRRKHNELEASKKDEIFKLEQEILRFKEGLHSNYEEIQWLRRLIEIITVPADKEETIARLIEERKRGI